ncbi:hypothetical protein [Micromonospora sp. NPDC005161]
MIDAIVAEVEENVRHDMIESGLNERFDLRIRNSRDHADPFGEPNVSRVIVGGTIAESGTPRSASPNTSTPATSAPRTAPWCCSTC